MKQPRHQPAPLGLGRDANIGDAVGKGEQVSHDKRVGAFLHGLLLAALEEPGRLDAILGQAAVEQHRGRHRLMAYAEGLLFEIAQAVRRLLQAAFQDLRILAGKQLGQRQFADAGQQADAERFLRLAAVDCCGQQRQADGTGQRMRPEARVVEAAAFAAAMNRQQRESQGQRPHGRHAQHTDRVAQRNDRRLIGAVRPVGNLEQPDRKDRVRLQRMCQHAQRSGFPLGQADQRQRRPLGDRKILHRPDFLEAIKGGGTKRQVEFLAGHPATYIINMWPWAMTASGFGTLK